MKWKVEITGPGSACYRGKSLPPARWPRRITVNGPATETEAVAAAATAIGVKLADIVDAKAVPFEPPKASPANANHEDDESDA